MPLDMSWTNSRLSNRTTNRQVRKNNSKFIGPAPKYPPNRIMSWPPIEPSENCRFYNFLSLKKFPYYSFADSIWSIMSGDSPNYHNRTAEAFDYSSSSNQAEGRPQLLDSKAITSDGRSSPVPTTSKDVAVQNPRSEEKGGDKLGKGEVQASVLVEPGGGKDEDDKEKMGAPTLNNSEHAEEYEKDEEKKSKNNGGGYEGRDKKDRKDDKFKKNGNIDKLDGVWIPKDKKQQDEQEDNCIVKCLYVTMTCCECSIM